MDRNKHNLTTSAWEKLRDDAEDVIEDRTLTSNERLLARRLLDVMRMVEEHEAEESAVPRPASDVVLTAPAVVPPAPPPVTHLDLLPMVAENDVRVLLQKEKDYGSSWKKRGGVGAFMMLARKWDRIEKQVAELGWDVLGALAMDRRQEGLLDDLADLRRYLMLVEAEHAARVA